jgi:hypothetical protein
MQVELSSGARLVLADESYVGCRLASGKLVDEVAFTSRPGGWPCVASDATEHHWPNLCLSGFLTWSKSAPECAKQGMQAWSRCAMQPTALYA